MRCYTAVFVRPTAPSESTGLVPTAEFPVTGGTTFRADRRISIVQPNNGHGHGNWVRPPTLRAGGD